MEAKIAGSIAIDPPTKLRHNSARKLRIDTKENVMSAINNVKVMGVRKETDSLGEVDVPSTKERKRNGRSNISTSARI